MSKLVLIDDDLTYTAIMQRAAEQAGIRLDVYSSLLELGSVALLGRYDAAIVDYHLEQMTGFEVAEYMSALFAHLPMVLVSSAMPDEARTWPGSIAAFIPKAAGYRYVIEEADRLARSAYNLR